MTPATSADDPEVEVWAPGATEQPACTSENGPGSAETCVVSPLPGRSSVTPGGWRVVVRGASQAGSADGRHHYSVTLQVPAVAPSAACAAAARSAVEGLEAVNDTTLDTIGPVALVAAHSDHELVRVHAVRGGQPVDYVVSGETLGGDPCLVYAVARLEEAEALRDDGAPATGAPSAVCQAAARRAVQAVEGLNEREVTVGTPALVAAHSDRELVRVPITRAGEADSYLVSAETLGGDPCLVYGLQLRSEELDLATTAP